VQVFARDDGLFDVEARLTDTKSHDLTLAGGLRRAGEPIHEMLLHLTVDRSFEITAAASETLWMPYIPACSEHGNAYAQLVGLNLLKGFRRAVNERLSGVHGCTHLTELTQVLPTAVIQAFAGSVIDNREGHDAGAPGDADHPPHQLDRCHALRRDGPTVAKHYPRWSLAVAASNTPS
jgi:hypothetical protein